MDKIVYCFRVFLALLVMVLWIFLCVLLIPASLVMFSVADSGSVKELLSKSGVYDRVVEVGVGSVLYRVKNISDSSEVVLESNMEKLVLSEKSVIEKAKKVFPADWIAAEVEKNIDALYGYVSGESERLVLMINLSDRNSEARGAVAEVFKTMVSSLPKCPVGIVGEYEDFDLFSATCLPQNMDVGQMYAIIDNGVEKIAPISSETEKIARLDLGDNLAHVKRMFGLIRYVFVLVWSVAFLLFLTIWWSVPGFENKLRVVGLSLSLLGVFAVLVGFGFLFSYKGLLEELVFSRVSLADVEAVKLGIDVVVFAIRNLINQLVVLGIVFVAIGITVYRENRNKKLKLHHKGIQKISYFVGVILVMILVWSVVGLVESNMGA